MSKRTSGLGRGIDNIFLENTIDDSAEKGTPVKIRLSLIEPKPGQPRKTFDNESLSQLADSIAAHGVIQPILLRELDFGRYQIIAGERRYRASKLAGLTEIPAIIIDSDEKKTAQLALVENIQRENLNPLEEALAYRSLADDWGMTQEEISREIGKSRSAIANSLRLLDLPEELRPLISSGELSAGHARTLLGLRDRAKIVSLAKHAVEAGLSVRALEEEVKRTNKRDMRALEEAEKKPELVNYTVELEKRVMATLGRRVKINNDKSKCVTLYFEDNEDLENLLRVLCGDGFISEI